LGTQFRGFGLGIRLRYELCAVFGRMHCSVWNQHHTTVVEFCGIIGFQRLLENFGGWKENRVLKN